MTDDKMTIKEDIERQLVALLTRAENMGLVITVELRPQRPLAMGNYWMAGSVREAREPAC